MHAKFTEGSILGHISVMTLASATGMLLMFFVDVLDMFWLSLLGEVALAAALGYAGSILFFTLSLGIGLSIACSAVVSQAIGEGDERKIKVLVGSVLVITLLVSLPIFVVVLVSLGPALELLGASDQAYIFARNYMWIVLPSMPLMTVSMAATGVLRAFGRAKESMYVTLIAGIVNAVLDPLFIFGFGWGVEGAAVATSLSRVAMISYALWQIVVVKNCCCLPSKAEAISCARTFFKVAVPAMLTNLSTPISFGFITSMMARFGDSAVAGNTVLVKIQPVAFVGLLALSGAIGPIVGQNFGAGKPERIMDVLKQSTVFVALYCLVACSILFVMADVLIFIFKAKNDAAELIRYFCWGLSTAFFFHGLSFCSTAMFNNLKVPHWATWINLIRATVFTMPFAYYGAEFGGPVGVWVGVYIGSVIIAAIGMLLAYYRVRQIMKIHRANP